MERKTFKHELPGAGRDMLFESFYVDAVRKDGKYSYELIGCYLFREEYLKRFDSLDEAYSYVDSLPEIREGEIL